jgi:hypothetical protein
MSLLSDFQILNGSGGGGAAYRREDQLTTGIISPKQFERLEITMGKATTLIRLNVSEPCFVRIFGRRDFTDANPFEFLAYQNYLSFEGAVWDTLGTVWGNNRHPTLANKDRFPNSKMYIEVANPYDDPIQVQLDLAWLVLED